MPNEIRPPFAPCTPLRARRRLMLENGACDCEWCVLEVAEGWRTPGETFACTANPASGEFADIVEMLARRDLKGADTALDWYNEERCVVCNKKADGISGPTDANPEPTLRCYSCAASTAGSFEPI